MKARFRALLVALLVALLPSGLLVAAPAEAATPTVIVCNGSFSADDLELYNNSVGVRVWVNQGSCREISDYAGNARVDVDVGAHEGDVRRWRKREQCCSWSQWFYNEMEDSNPFSGTTANTKTTHYQTES